MPIGLRYYASCSLIIIGSFYIHMTWIKLLNTSSHAHAHITIVVPAYKIVLRSDRIYSFYIVNK